MPIPDFRTVAGRHVECPSPDLLDTIHLCQQRQEWYREFAWSIGERPLAIVGSVTVTTDVVLASEQIRDAIGFDLEERRRTPTWTDALRRFIELADAAGVMVMGERRCRGATCPLEVFRHEYDRALVVSTLEGRSSFTKPFGCSGSRRWRCFATWDTAWAWLSDSVPS